ncbi:MAG: hypothetical protein HYY02_07880 [Chloroflexi bacterium]|nr:hypothetical protein [Chloroflexota bacterium]
MNVRIGIAVLSVACATLVSGTVWASQDSRQSAPVSPEDDPAKTTLADAAVVLGAQPRLQWPPDGWTVDSLTPALRWQADGYSQVWVALRGSSLAAVEVTVPKGQDTYTITSPLTPGSVYRWRVRSNPYPPGQSVYTWGPWSVEYTFTTPGALPWKDSAFVQLVSPRNGTLSSTIAPTLSWVPPAGSTHYEMVITPAGNEAASVRFVNTISSTYPIPGPPTWYGMLPDTLYYWRVRVNNASSPVPGDHPSWGPWTDAWAFRTPMPATDIISAVTPKNGEAVAGPTPTLAWENASSHIFYYEIQISRDPDFTVDPQRATSALYWETVHGGLTTPRNSYTVRSKYPLQRGQVYYWRVRPAVALPSRPMGWSPTWSFRVP